MQRTFERKSTLPPVRCDLPTLEAFINELVGEFSPERAEVRISTHLPGEEVSFESVDEVQRHSELPAVLRKVSLRISAAGLGLSGRRLYLSGIYGDLPSVEVEGGTPSWCAGLVARARDFARKNRAWYWFLKPWLVWPISMAVPIVVLVATRGDSLLGGLVALLLLALSYWLTFGYRRIFKPFSVVVRREENFLRRKKTEIVVLSTAVMAIAALVALGSCPARRAVETPPTAPATPNR